jgi:ribosomal-protein-alanine N-acetyltransferase
VIGFCALRLVVDELHVENLGIDESRRRQGLGRFLLEAAIAAGLRHGARKALLEVRASNAAAQALYLSMGFHEVATRAGYYSAPLEDAIVLARDL